MKRLDFNRLLWAALIAVTLPLAACDQASDASAGEARPAKAERQGHSQREAGRDRAPGKPAAGPDHKGEGHGEPEAGQRKVHLTTAQRKRLDLKIAAAEAGSATAVVQAPATVRFDADRVAKVGPRLEAKVVTVTKDLGETVKAGETVAVLDSVQLGRAKARYLTAQARFGTALAEYQRDRKLAKQQITSEAELLQSKAAYLQAQAERDAARAELRLYGLDQKDIAGIAVGGEQPLSRYYLSAPIAGTIQRRDLVTGQTVSAQETPIHIVNSRRMWVMIDAFEQDLARLRPGQPVKLTVRALPGQSFTGKTDWVSHELDEQSRTVRVRAVVANDNGALRAGMFGTARIQTDAEQRFALVPVDAVQTVGEDKLVFVPAEEAGAFRAVVVQTGAEGDGQIEIRQGIEPGDKVVVAGAFDLMSALTASGRSASHGH